jgi:nicotinate-nucleotide adenylyltransferase
LPIRQHSIDVTSNLIPRASIALYGGSFDPVHLGHLLVAQAAWEELGLARLFFIPAAQSPFKPLQPPTPAAERLQLLRLALAGGTGYEIDDQETQRGGVSYTIDTVRDYKARFPDHVIYYLIGADHVSTLPKWREATALAEAVTFVVIPRPGEPPHPPPEPFRFHSLSGFPLKVSSSQIRERVRAGKTIRHLVPDAVREAIRNNGLYL